MPEHATKEAAPVAGPRSAGDAPPAPSETDKLIERWFAEHFHGSLISRNADHYAEAFRAKEALKQRLADRRE
jgi:hypothetical protein